MSSTRKLVPPRSSARKLPRSESNQIGIKQGPYVSAKDAQSCNQRKSQGSSVSYVSFRAWISTSVIAPPPPHTQIVVWGLRGRAGFRDDDDVNQVPLGFQLCGVNIRDFIFFVCVCRWK